MKKPTCVTDVQPSAYFPAHVIFTLCGHGPHLRPIDSCKVGQVFACPWCEEEADALPKTTITS